MDNRSLPTIDLSKFPIINDSKSDMHIGSFDITNFNPNLDSFKLGSMISDRMMKSKSDSLNGLSGDQVLKFRRKNTLTEKKNTLNDFTNLLKLLMVLFKGDEFSCDDLKMSDLEFKVLKAILLRKMLIKNKRDIKSKLEKELDEKWQKLDFEGLAKSIVEIAQTINRRAEEKYKFVFKMIMKIQTHRFFENNHYYLIQQNKEDKLKRFWEFYFKDYCKEKNIPIEHLYDPLNRRLLKNSKWKALTSDYLRLLYGNKAYKDFSIEVMENDIKDIYLEGIELKFFQILEMIKTELNLNINRDISEERQEELIQKKILRAGTKIPWTSYGITNAINRFLKQLNKLNV